MKKPDFRWIWIGLAVIALAVQAWFGFHPQLAENYYSLGLFPYIRKIQTAVFSWWPLPATPVIAFFLFGIAIWRLVRQGHRNSRKWTLRLRRHFFSLAAVLAAILFFFLLLWGYNYQRIPIEEKIGLEIPPVDSALFLQEWRRISDSLRSSRAEIKGSAPEEPLSFNVLPGIRDTTRALMQRTIRALGYPAEDYVRARLIRPRGVMLSFSTPGIYSPFTGETNVDAGIHFLELPFVLAHEYGHAYGFADEGTCNFLALLACTSSKDPLIRYSGYLDYWRYLAAQCKRQYPEAYAVLRENLPAGIPADLENIYQHMQRFPDIMPQLQRLIHNFYLKSQGIEEGTGNYARVIDLGIAWHLTGREF